MNIHSYEMLDARIRDMSKGELAVGGGQSLWLMPAKDNLRHGVSETYGPGDYRIRMLILSARTETQPIT